MHGSGSGPRPRPSWYARTPHTRRGRDAARPMPWRDDRDPVPPPRESIGPGPAATALPRALVTRIPMSQVRVKRLLIIPRFPLLVVILALAVVGCRRAKAELEVSTKVID